MDLRESPFAPTSDSTGNYPAPTAPRTQDRIGVEVGAKTDRGKVRKNNEDHFLVARLAKSMFVCKTSLPGDAGTHLSEELGYMMVVADGMGGAAAGEHASALAVQSVEQFVLNTLKRFLHLGGPEQHALYTELREGLERADRAIIERARRDPALHGMGTTLTMAYSIGSDLFIVHAGDSRAYLYRDGSLQQLTKDHTLVQLLVTGGALKPEDAKKHHSRNVVTNVLGGPEAGVLAEIRKVTLADRDQFLICSDGLTEVVEDDAVAAILREAESADVACDRLVARAIERGGPDNITVVVARYRFE